MKIRNTIIIILLTGLSLLIFSPYAIKAAEEGDSSSIDDSAGDTKSVDSSADNSRTEPANPNQDTVNQSKLNSAEQSTQTEDQGAENQETETTSENTTDTNSKESEGETKTTPKTEKSNSTSNIQNNDPSSLSIQTKESAPFDSLPFEKGEKSPEIAVFKEKLNAIGFGNIWVTDYFGNFTKEQVIMFQEYYSLNATGIVNQTTSDKINEIYNSPFQNGNHHEEISGMKQRLNRIGYGKILVTDYFGAFTEKQVKEFQTDYNLVANGIADEKTRKQLRDVVADIDFRQGDRDESISEMKTKLNHIGFGDIWVTDYFGSFTAQQVEEFQTYYGLEVTGVADKTTRTKLNQVYNSPFQKGKRHNDTSSLKQKFNRLDYDNILVTDYFGSFTEKQVKQFQKDYGLIVNGIVDEVTQSKLNGIISKKGFQQGDRDESISEMKTKLNRIGFGDIWVTDYYGNFTSQQVKGFQQYYGLEATGSANKTTLEKIDQVHNSPFQVGKHHEEMNLLKEKLNRLGYGHILVTDYFGSFTKKQVMEFQHDYGLVVNGILDEVTQAKLQEAAANRDFQQGDRDEAISEMKVKLNKIGFGNILVTNYFGSYTKQRIMDLQEYYGLEVTGKANKTTLKKIGDVYNSPFQEGKSHNEIIGLKKKLNRLGYGPVLVTSYFGNYTEKQVKAFQRDYGLPVNGIVDSLTRDEINEAASTVRIFLDPGHGGHDPGAQAYGLNEKDVVLDIAKSSASYLSQTYYGVEVRVSRTTDKFIELEERANMANQWNADYFVSIHNNSFLGLGSGFESYIHDSYVSRETEQLQKQMHLYLMNQLNVLNRGIKAADFSVLRNTAMPAILLEYLFIDNVVENAYLRDSAYRKWLGKITAEAIASSFDLRKR